MYSINTNTATNALMEYARSIAPQGMEAYALAPHESEGESPMIWVAFTRIGEEKGVWDDVLIPYDHLPPAAQEVAEALPPLEALLEFSKEFGHLLGEDIEHVVAELEDWALWWDRDGTLIFVHQDKDEAVPADKVLKAVQDMAKDATSHWRSCPACYGSGGGPEARLACPACGGTGHNDDPVPWWLDSLAGERLL